MDRLISRHRPLSKEAHTAPPLNYFQLQMALNASSIVAITNAAGVIIEVNQAFCDISKYERQEVIGQTHALLRSGVHDAAFYKKLWHTITSGDVWNGEICNRAKDGTLYWVYSTIIPARDPQGRIASYLAIRHDITAKKVLEQKHQQALSDLQKTTSALQARIDETEALLQNMTEGVVVHDADGRIIQFNQAALQILGITERQITGVDSFDPRWHTVRENGQPFPPDEHPAVQALRLGRRVTNVMMGVQRSPGDLRWIMINASPMIENGSHRISRALVTFSDITGQRQQEAHLLQASKLSSLGEVSAAIAHEINNPLTVISGHAQHMQKMLKSNNLKPEQLEQSLGKIRDHIERITKIVNGLRSFTRNSADDPMEAISVRTLVDNTLTLCQAKFNDHQVIMRVHPFAEASSLECRPSQISQVLLNLLNNALDAVEGNSLPDRVVELSVSETAESIVFKVSDNGPGIPEAIRGKILEAFYTTKPPGKGTGLGLSISLSIVKKHQGALQLDPSSPKTCFVVTLPKKQSSLSPIPASA